MASPLRPPKRAKGSSGKSSGAGSRPRKKNIGEFYPFPDPEQPILNVQPLNSVPYTGPLLPEDPLEMDIDDVKEKSEPAMWFLPTEPSEAKLREMALSEHGFGVSGSAMNCKVGPPVGMMDIRESADTYYFRVSLPGLSKASDSSPSFDIQPNGKVTIKGVITTGKKHIQMGPRVFRMNSNNLCPPGPLELSFVLPGPIDGWNYSGSFEQDGCFEGSAKKKPIE